jgi:hypothetical protein
VISVNYDGAKGWEHTNRGWYEYHVKFYDATSTADLIGKSEEIVEWLYKNIDNPERHARWAPYDVGMRVKFRFEKDALMFALRWL